MTTDAEYIKIAEEAWEEAVEIVKSLDGWKDEKNDKKTGDIVQSRKNSKGRKIYRCKAKINIPPKLLSDAMSDTDNVTSWNKTLTEARVLKKLSDSCAISYQVRNQNFAWRTLHHNSLTHFDKSIKYLESLLFVAGHKIVSMKIL